MLNIKRGREGGREGGRTRQKEDSDAKNIKVQEYKSTLTGGAVETQTYNDKVSITLHNGVYSEWAHKYKCNPNRLKYTHKVLNITVH